MKSIFRILRKIKRLKEPGKLNFLVKRLNIQLRYYLIFNNIFQKFISLEKRIYKLKDPNNGEILISPTHIQMAPMVRDLYYKKKFFKNISKVAEQIDASLIIDIGANIGYYSRACAINNKNLEIISIEPDLGNLAFASMNLRDLKNIYLYHIGLSNKFGRFNVDSPIYSKERIGEMKFDTGLFTAINNEDSLGTRFITFDDFSKFLKINASEIAWIKIDVEGFELSVLEGMTNTLKSTSAIFQVEINANTMNLSNTSINEIIDTMTKNDFKPFIDQDLNVSQYLQDIKIKTIDIFFIKTEIAERIEGIMNLKIFTNENCERWMENYKISEKNIE